MYMHMYIYIHIERDIIWPCISNVHVLARAESEDPSIIMSMCMFYVYVY